jgi:hypothetical protein
MSIDLGEVLKSLGGQISTKVVENVKSAAQQLSDRDMEIVEQASLRKAELLLARMLGQDTSYDETKIDETLALIASKASRIARETVKKTVLEVVSEAGKFALKLAFGAIIP